MHRFVVKPPAANSPRSGWLAGPFLSFARSSSSFLRRGRLLSIAAQDQVFFSFGPSSSKKRAIFKAHLPDTSKLLQKVPDGLILLRSAQFYKAIFVARISFLPRKIAPGWIGYEVDSCGSCIRRQETPGSAPHICLSRTILALASAHLLGLRALGSRTVSAPPSSFCRPSSSGGSAPLNVATDCLLYLVYFASRKLLLERTPASHSLLIVLGKAKTTYHDRFGSGPIWRLQPL